MAIIGIPVRYDHSKDEDKSILYIFESLRLSIQKAGGDIFLIIPTQDFDYMDTRVRDFPPLSDFEKERIRSIVDKCDGLFLPGGIKFTPFDRYILDYAIEKDVPTLGVCLSMQMMSCYQEDVQLEENDSSINHHQLDVSDAHEVIIDKNSKLYKIVGKENILVNSIHNYHALENHIYKTVAKSPDGIIEAIEHPTATFNIGLQWHPEKDYDIDQNSQKILNTFIEYAKDYSKRKYL